MGCVTSLEINIFLFTGFGPDIFYMRTYTSYLKWPMFVDETCNRESRSDRSSIVCNFRDNLSIDHVSSGVNFCENARVCRKCIHSRPIYPLLLSSRRKFRIRLSEIKGPNGWSVYIRIPERERGRGRWGNKKTIIGTGNVYKINNGKWPEKGESGPKLLFDQQGPMASRLWILINDRRFFSCSSK